MYPVARAAGAAATSQPLWNTQNDLAEKVRAGAVELLNQQLADALDLALQAKQAHWNVKVPNIDSGRQHVTALSAALARFGASARAGIDAGTALGDADTADLFTEISRRVDKLLWKVRVPRAGPGLKKRRVRWPHKWRNYPRKASHCRRPTVTSTNSRKR